MEIGEGTTLTEEFQLIIVWWMKEIEKSPDPWMNAKIRGWKFKFQSISPQIFINYRRMHVILLIVGTTLTQAIKVDIVNKINIEVTGSLTWCTERSCHLWRFFPKCMTSVYSWETWGFPGGSVSKESACNAGDPGLIPGLQRSPGEENGYPLQYSSLGNSRDRRAWQAASHTVAKNWTWLSN